MIKAALVLIALILLGLVWGAHSTFVGLRDREPAAMTCADYLAKPPRGKWVRLRECAADFAHGEVIYDGTSVEDVYLAIRPRGVTEGPSRIVFQFDEDADEFTRPPTPSLHQRASAVQGMLRTGWLDDVSDEVRARMARGMNLTPDFVIVHVGAKPHLWLGLLAFLGGLGGLTLCIRAIYFRLRRPTA